MFQNGFKMADQIIKEGNNEVQAQIPKKVLNCNALPQGNMKVSTGVRRN